MACPWDRTVTFARRYMLRPLHILYNSSPSSSYTEEEPGTLTESEGEEEEPHAAIDHDEVAEAD